MAKKNVTFQDIAKYTGFSKTTISRFFNNPDTVTPENQEKIREALEVLDYKGNKVGKILASGKTEFVGLIIPNLYMSFFAEILNQFLKSYQKYGYKFLVFSANSDKEIERQYISELLAYNVEGLVILSDTISSYELASYNIPVVTLEREDRYVNSVNTDNYRGGKQAAELLLRSGCEVFLHMNTLVSDPEIPSNGRITGFLDVCKENNLPYHIYHHSAGRSYEEMREEIDEIVELIATEYPGKRKGIFCSNDNTANIVLNGLYARFGALPEEYCIVGFDDSPISRESVLPISTVGQQTGQMVDKAMELLISQIEYKKKNPVGIPEAPRHETVSPVLIERATTNPLQQRNEGGSFSDNHNQGTVL